MNSVVRDFERVQEAFSRPTLGLLNKRYAPYVLTILGALLPAEQTRMSADVFHVRVDTALEVLRGVDTDAPSVSAKELCRQWVQQAWLSRSTNGQDQEEYALTSHAQEALEFVQRLSGQRAVLGESRIRTILDAASRCAQAANPDPTERIRRLESQIAAQSAELERLKAGGEVPPVSTDHLMDAYLNLQQLLNALPSDFLRVSEAVKTIHRSMVADLRGEQRSPGEVIDSYLERADDLMGASLAGRAFRGAVELLRDENTLEQMGEDLDAILQHEFTEALTLAERLALRQTVNVIRRGIDTVLAERRRLSGSLARHIKRYDVMRDRELDETLTSIEQALAAWMRTSGQRSRVPLDLGASRIDVVHLRERTYDPVEHAPPAKLTRPDPPDPADLLARAREQGGPDLSALSARVRAHLRDQADAGSALSASDMFNSLPDALRRPVEVIGLLHAMAGADVALTASAGTASEYRTRRPDGTERVFFGPDLTITHSTHDAVEPDASASPSSEEPS